MEIRDAHSTHLAEITALYNHAVEHTTAIWNERTVDIEDRAQWLAQREQSGFPVLVSLGEAGEVLGYASYGPFRPHDGYRRTVENSIYVRPDQQGNGIGRALLAALIDRARERGVHVIIAGIEDGNTGSLRLHEKAGFVRTGTLPQVGMKFDRWLDLALLQLQLDDRPEPDAGTDPRPAR